MHPAAGLREDHTPREMPREQYFFAADLGGTKLTAALVNPRGRIVARRSAPVDKSSRLAPVRQIVALAEDLRRENGSVRLRAAGIAVPGLVRANGTVWAPNLPGWQALPLARLLRRALRIPVYVESDRNAVVLGEAWRGAARGLSDVVVLIVGTGIGAGILSGGRLVRGAHELSGCAGWMAFTDPSTPQARRCGQLESLCAGPAIARAARAATAAEVAAAARRGERASLRVLRNVGTQLGLAVANLVSLFDPQMVVLTGGVFHAAGWILPSLRRAARQHAQPLSVRKVKITVSRMGGDANLLGAAYLALTNQRASIRRYGGKL